MRTNDVVSMRPFVVFAIRLMSPGPRRVQMVKLAHAMADGRAGSKPSHRSLRVAATRPTTHIAPSRQAP